VDVESDAVLADAKIDGPIAAAFALQDQIVAAFARSLGIHRATAEPPSTRETSNLEAYRAYVEGWLKIESLDAALTRAAAADFERAIALDSRYAMAFTGLAVAELQVYEMTRAGREPQVRALASGIEHARHAVRLDARLAEGHATLSFLLVSAGEIAEARAAARQALALDPENWRHLYRLGHALWGDARLRAFERALAIYPDFAWPRFEMAMVHVARRRLADAEAVVREGVALQDRQARAADRFPAIGFHWLLGTLLAAGDRHDEACLEFDRERTQAGRQRMYGPEYAAASSIGLGFSRLAQGRLDDALGAFREALAHVPGMARAALAVSAALARAGRHAEAAAAREEAARDRAIVATHRPAEALTLAAADEAWFGSADAAVRILAPSLDADPPSFAGWMLGIDPLLAALRGHPGFAALLATLAARAG
jgi:tetratricopeptide (TPR) repeat protein